MDSSKVNINRSSIEMKQSLDDEYTPERGLRESMEPELLAEVKEKKKRKVRKVLKKKNKPVTNKNEI